MTGDIESRLKELGIKLPDPSAAGANYVPFMAGGERIALQRSG